MAKKVIITIKYPINGDTSFRIKYAGDFAVIVNRVNMDCVIATHVLTDDNIKELPFECYIPINNISSINILDDGE